MYEGLKSDVKGYILFVENTQLAFPFTYPDCLALGPSQYRVKADSYFWDVILCGGDGLLKAQIQEVAFVETDSGRESIGVSFDKVKVSRPEGYGFDISLKSSKTWYIDNLEQLVQRGSGYCENCR
jgi:hypothetical protein